MHFSWITTVPQLWSEQMNKLIFLFSGETSVSKKHEWYEIYYKKKKKRIIIVKQIIFYCAPIPNNYVKTVRV